MSHSSAAVSPQRARDPAGQRVPIGGRVARLRTLVAPRARAGDRLEITIPVPDLRVIDRSFATAQPFNRKHVGLRLEDTASAVGARWDRRSLDCREHEGHRTRGGILWPARRGRKTGATVNAGASLAVESARKTTRNEKGTKPCCEIS